MSRRFYWDSCTFIDRIARHPGRIAVLEEITDAATDGKIQIIASTLCIVETHKLKDSKDSADVQTQLIFDFFENPWIEVVAVDPFIAELAHKIARDYKVKPPDAIHVATAIARKAEVIHTYDGLGPNAKAHSLLKFDGKINSPPLAIKVPATLEPQKKFEFDAGGDGQNAPGGRLPTPERSS